MQFQMNKHNNPMSNTKSKKVGPTRCSDSVQLIVMADCFLYIRHRVLFFPSLSLGYISANSFSYCLRRLNCRALSSCHPLWILWMGNKRRPVLLNFWGLCLRAENGPGWDVEPALFYDVVLSVTWQLTAVQLFRCLANSPVLFSI